MKEYIEKELTEMGFDPKLIQKAMNATPCESLDQVMEYIINHESEDSNDIEIIEAKTETVESETSAEPLRQLTEEELAEERRKLEEKIKQRRVERKERELREEIEREKNRRKVGSDMSKIKEEYETRERIRIAEEIRRDKLREKAHLEALRYKIKCDREAMKRDSVTPQAKPSSGPSKPPILVSSGSSSACKLAIRFPNGQSIVQTFSDNEPLAAVRLFVETTRRKDEEVENPRFNIVLPPGKTFSDEEMQKSLRELGLCPSARLIVSDIKSF